MRGRAEGCVVGSGPLPGFAPPPPEAPGGGLGPEVGGGGRAGHRPPPSPRGGLWRWRPTGKPEMRPAPRTGLKFPRSWELFKKVCQLFRNCAKTIAKFSTGASTLRTLRKVKIACKLFPESCTQLVNFSETARSVCKLFRTCGRAWRLYRKCSKFGCPSPPGFWERWGCVSGVGVGGSARSGAPPSTSCRIGASPPAWGRWQERRAWGPACSQIRGGHRGRRGHYSSAESESQKPWAGAGARAVWGTGTRGGSCAPPSKALHVFHLQGQGVRLLLPPGHHLDQHS